MASEKTKDLEKTHAKALNAHFDVKLRASPTVQMEDCFVNTEQCKKKMKCDEIEMLEKVLNEVNSQKTSGVKTHKRMSPNRKAALRRKLCQNIFSKTKETVKIISQDKACEVKPQLISSSVNPQDIPSALNSVDENILRKVKPQAVSSSTVACLATCVAGSETNIFDNKCPDKLVNGTSYTSETNVSTAVAEQQESVVDKRGHIIQKSETEQWKIINKDNSREVKPQTISSSVNPQDVPSALNSDCPVIGTDVHTQNIFGSALPENQTPVEFALNLKKSLEKQLQELEQRKTGIENILRKIKPLTVSSSTVAARATCVAGTSSTSETNVSAAVAEQQEYRPKKILDWAKLILKSNVGKTVRDTMSVKDFCSQIDIYNKLSKLEVLDNSPASAEIVYDFKDGFGDEPLDKVIKDFVMFYFINVYVKMGSVEQCDKSNFVSEFHKKCPPAFTYFSARFLPPEVTELTMENVVNFLTTIGIISIFQRFHE